MIQRLVIEQSLVIAQRITLNENEPKPIPNPDCEDCGVCHPPDETCPEPGKQTDGVTGYSDLLDQDEQVEAEEAIAPVIFDHPNCDLDEETCGDLGRIILRAVLARFRPDLLS